MIFGTTSYVTYKIEETSRFKELYFDSLPDKRQYLLSVHQKAAYSFDRIFDKYETTSKIVTHHRAT